MMLGDARPSTDNARAPRWVPIRNLVVVGPQTPTDAESIALARFVREVRRVTGVTLPVVFGEVPSRPVVLVGNRATLPEQFRQWGDIVPPPRDGEDVARQSYVVGLMAGRSRARPVILAAGLGADRTARGHLGTAYALGDLLRRLDIRGNQWGFLLPEQPVGQVPTVTHRILYVMNSSLQNPGLSLEHFNEEQVQDYVDSLVEARFSRVCLFQWGEYYLYPGNAPSFESDRQRVRRVMRQFFQRARQRGLEVYLQFSISHAIPEVLPEGGRLRAQGYYAPYSVCWSQPEARKLAAEMARLEMTYYGPADGYMVWFYDPGGCFCQECATHQSERIFDQLMTVVKLAEVISPGARFQASLWPTWAFAREKERVGHPGRGYTEMEVREFVTDFLNRCLRQFGRRKLTIIDSLEGDETNIYNGNVRREDFLRSGFLYTVQGMPSENVYPFPLFRIHDTVEQMARARERGLNEAQIFIQYSATNFPSVYAFADSLYSRDATYEAVADRLVSTLAKGDARAPFRAFLDAVEELGRATTWEAAHQAVVRLKEAAEQTLGRGGFVGNPDWLRGYVLAQQYYLQLAGARDDQEFASIAERFRNDLAALPLYAHYAQNTLSVDLLRKHVKTFWSAFVHGSARGG